LTIQGKTTVSDSEGERGQISTLDLMESNEGKQGQVSVEARVMFGEIEIRSMSKFSPITSSHQTSISLQYDAWKVSNKELQDGKFDLRYVSSF
jgi:hypothetical protein